MLRDYQKCGCLILFLAFLLLSKSALAQGMELNLPYSVDSAGNAILEGTSEDQPLGLDLQDIYNIQSLEIQNIQGKSVTPGKTPTQTNVKLGDPVAVDLKILLTRRKDAVVSGIRIENPKEHLSLMMYLKLVAVEGEVCATPKLFHLLEICPKIDGTIKGETLFQRFEVVSQTGLPFPLHVDNDSSEVEIRSSTINFTIHFDNQKPHGPMPAWKANTSIPFPQEASVIVRAYIRVYDPFELRLGNPDPDLFLSDVDDEKRSPEIRFHQPSFKIFPHGVSKESKQFAEALNDSLKVREGRSIDDLLTEFEADRLLDLLNSGKETILVIPFLMAPAPKTPGPAKRDNNPPVKI